MNKKPENIKAKANVAMKKYMYGTDSRDDLFQEAILAQNQALIELQCQILEIELEKRKEKNE